MTNEIKLLRAFIEASGYDIEEEFILHIACKCRPNSAVLGGDRDCDICCGTGQDGGDFDYKVTKKPNPLHVYYDDVQLEQLVANVIHLSECNDSERWIKYPKASFDAVVDWFGFQAERANAHRYIILGVEVSLDEKT